MLQWQEFNFIFNAKAMQCKEWLSAAGAQAQAEAEAKEEREAARLKRK